ncbi:MAG TPA: hypothetical protein VFF28_07150 [Candidatus Nanoarchaeia archaeon]|nr:hypothetical protein [Candidatus Nanoarchaeia archaeon]
MQYIEGILKIANLILAVLAGVIGASLINVCRKKKELRPWLLLIGALIFFAVQEILGALRAFKVFTSPYLTHIVPTIILVLLVVAVVEQLHLTRGK